MTERIEKLRQEYVTGSESYRTLANKHGIPYHTLAKTAKSESWHALRLAHRQNERRLPDTVDIKTVANDLLLKVHAAVSVLDTEDPDLSRIKQLAGILKDLRDVPLQTRGEDTSIRVTFAGKTGEFSA